MGTVFKALDLRKLEASDRRPYVAIKVLNLQFRGNPKSLIALQREARKAQTLAHRNIVTVYDFDRDGSVVYLTMEYLSGQPLSRMLRNPNFKGMPFARGLPDLQGHGERARLRARTRLRALRLQAGQRVSHRYRRSQGDRLRHRARVPAAGRGNRGDHLRSRQSRRADARVREPGDAGASRARSARRRLRARLHHLRTADRQASVRPRARDAGAQREHEAAASRQSRQQAMAGDQGGAVVRPRNAHADRRAVSRRVERGAARRRRGRRRSRR